MQYAQRAENEQLDRELGLVNHRVAGLFSTAPFPPGADVGSGAGTGSWTYGEE
jgi:hypothetical protein